MIIPWQIRQWWNRLRAKPYVLLSYSGQLTSRPQVHVSVHNYMSAQGVYTWDANDVGNARAEMYGKGLADIIKAPLVDER